MIRAGTIFVDTNVLVYARDRTDEDKHLRATEWMAALWDSGMGRLSWQVLHEYYVTMTVKLDLPRSSEETREDVLALTGWRPLPVDGPVVECAWDVQDRYRFSWWDSLIVAAALHIGAVHLLTEDLQDGQEVDGLRILDPFRHQPDAVVPRG